MATVMSKGVPISTYGDLPELGSDVPDFSLTKTDFSELTLRECLGKQIIINIFLSVDTGICSASVRRFNAEASKFDNTVVICVSKDLPYTHKRFCGAEGLDDVISVSDFRTGAFGRDFGVQITSGPITGLLSRAVVVVDTEGKVIYTEQVPEITQEPDYEAALKVLS